jgi:hypothetical protein
MSTELVKPFSFLIAFNPKKSKNMPRAVAAPFFAGTLANL